MFHWGSRGVRRLGGGLKINQQIIPEDEEISVFPFEERRAIYHAKKASNLALLCRSIPIPVGNRNVVGFRRWWPEANSLSYTCFSKPRWLLVKGIPFHLWIPSVLGKVGALCGGLVEIHPSTVEMSDLSFAKIKVKGELNRIPRRISLEFQSIIYPVELSVWEVELCDNCKMWPESMEIRYRRSWVVADGEISGKGGPRVPSGLDAITRDSGQISNFKPMRAEPDLIPVETAGVYGANDKMEEAGELISQKDPIRRLQSAKQAVGFMKGRRKARNRQRRARRQRLRRQRRLGVSVSRSGSVKIASELVQRVRSEKDQACEFGPSSNGPNQLGETLSSVESRLVETDQRGDEAQPSYDQPTTLGSEDPFGVNPIITCDNTTQTKKNCAVFSKSLGLQSVARDQAVGGPSSIDPLFQQVKSILQRHKADSPSLNSSPCRVSEAVGLDQVGELDQQSSRMESRNRVEFPIGDLEVLAKNHSEVSKVASSVVRQGSEEGDIMEVVSPNSSSSFSCSSPQGLFRQKLEPRFLHKNLAYNAFYELENTNCVISVFTFQLPMLLGVPILEKLAPPIATFFVGRTGRQLFLTDGRPSRPPLLLRMASDCEDGKFISALGAFICRTLYANVSYDRIP
ncbi:hypothetical protein HHK36_003587 [Tetracentron sinense]|uniref:DUF676 domain-containing protein n=1 Tax=Tetracentron sinense TaxID=13715 RepID=A0A835DP36_TETSI|nr:hypothetical protein HHK36_003587 [Tetracentron sinense]